MSADSRTEQVVDRPDSEDHDEGSFKTYMIGFLLSVALTAVPFWLVMTGTLAPAITGLIITGFAVVQIVVHMVFFLHMNHRSEGGWNMLALIFTLVILVIAVAGSVWVMYHLNVNMMPVHDMQGMG